MEQGAIFVVPVYLEAGVINYLNLLVNSNYTVPFKVKTEI